MCTCETLRSGMLQACREPEAAMHEAAFRCYMVDGAIQQLACECLKGQVLTVCLGVFALLEARCAVSWLPSLS